MGKKKKKVRVAFRKNRQKRARVGNLARAMREDDVQTADTESTERVSGKGDISRRRTVIAVEDEATGEFTIDVDESACLNGRVISAIGLNSTVQTADGRHYECTVRRIVRTMARDARNAVVAGDIVLFRPTDEAHGMIERVNPRRGVLSRGSQRHEHIIVANVDQVVIVVSADGDQLKTNLIDRLLISAEKGEVRPIICINKIDLVDPTELQPIVGTYARLGYDIMLTSVNENLGLSRLRHLLIDRETVFAGQSGVGKSSLLNAIQPGLGLQTGDISEWSGKGRHVTRRATLLELDDGGWVVDTPGIRQMQLWDVIPEEVEGYFVEFRPFVTQCRFPDCSHTHETGCGVKRAVVNEWIALERYESYLKIVEDKPRRSATRPIVR